MAHWLIEHAQEKDAAIAEGDPRFIELTNENRRLREALKKIARHGPEDTPFEACRYDMKIARKALGDE